MFATIVAQAAARPDAATIFEAPRELRSADRALRDATLDEIRHLGAGWLRVVLYWNDVAPQPDARVAPRFDERNPRRYDWCRAPRAGAKVSPARDRPRVETDPACRARPLSRRDRDEIERERATRWTATVVCRQ